MPEEKSEAIDRLAAEGRKVLMIGDGLNDAAALARAHAAVAPGTALAASQNAADLVLTGDALMAVVEAIDVARSARRRALENFGFAALYNVVAAPAAMLGLVNPFVAQPRFAQLSGHRQSKHVRAAAGGRCRCGTSRSRAIMWLPSTRAAMRRG